MSEISERDLSVKSVLAHRKKRDSFSIDALSLRISSTWFMQSKISGRKTASYYGFLKAIGEEDLPAFDDRQEAFIKYVSEMLPIVRPYEWILLTQTMNILACRSQLGLQIC